jgi:hypothetical protein
MRTLAILLLAAPLAAPAPGAEGTTPEEAARAVAPFLDDRTVAVLYVDLRALDVAALADRAAALGKPGAADLTELRQEGDALVKGLTAAGARDLFVVASLADLPGGPPFVVVPLPEKADADKVLDVLRRGKLGEDLRYEKVGRAFVGGSAATLRRLRAHQAVPRPEVAKALAGAGGSLARLAVVATTDTAKILEEVMPTLPEEVGGGSVKVLTRGLRWVAVGVDAPPRLAVRLTAQAADAGSAAAVRDLLARAVKAAGRNKAVRAALPNFDALAAVVPKVEGDRLVLALGEKELAPLLRPYVTRWQGGAERDRQGRQLRQIGQAMFRHHEAHGRFPAAAVYDKKGRPLLSWRVALLPYLGEGALYRDFKPDEPWDGPHNKKLIARMPAAYRSSPKLAAEGKMTYLAPLGKDTLFHGPQGTRISEVTDGTLATIFLVGADDAHAVVWTKPEDLPYDPAAPFAGLATRHGGYLTLFADGSVHLLPKAIDKKTMQALFTRNGGEAVEVPD